MPRTTAGMRAIDSGAVTYGLVLKAEWQWTY
jgi:hypothetical protein